MRGEGCEVSPQGSSLPPIRCAGRGKRRRTNDPTSYHLEGVWGLGVTDWGGKFGGGGERNRLMLLFFPLLPPPPLLKSCVMVGFVILPPPPRSFPRHNLTFGLLLCLPPSISRIFFLFLSLSPLFLSLSPLFLSLSLSLSPWIQTSIRYCNAERSIFSYHRPELHFCYSRTILPTWVDKKKSSSIFYPFTVHEQKNNLRTK